MIVRGDQLVQDLEEPWDVRHKKQPSILENFINKFVRLRQMCELFGKKVEMPSPLL